MIRIQICPDLIAEFLTTGKVHEKTEIVEGIPPDHMLVDAQLMNTYCRRVLELTFVPLESVPQEPKSIIVKTIRHEEKR